MNHIHLGLLGTVLAVVGGLSVVASCSNVADDCREIGRCRPPDMGGATSTGVGGTPASSSSMAGATEVCCAFVGSAGTAGMAGAAGAASGISAMGGAHIAPCVTGTASDEQCAPCQSDAHCPATAPACDPLIQACVTCTADTHCSGTYPGCNTTTKTCVACTKDAHCSGATPVCDTSKNTCVTCAANADCTTDPSNVCDTNTSACVECLVSGDCRDPSKKVCLTTAKTCVQCLAATDCAGVAGKPACDTTPGSPTVNTCVACLENMDCQNTPAAPFCNKEKKQCVACLANTDCTNAAISRCDPTTNTCAPCATDNDCTQISGKSLCHSSATGQPNQCVECTVSNEKACNGDKNSCNPKTSTCTTTPKGSVGKCGACLADSECIGANVAAPTTRCVPMKVQGVDRPGGYCLQRAAGGCASPFKVYVSAPSLSDAGSEQYCGINQDATTCEAVSDLIASKACELDSNCGNNQGGVCRNFALPAAPPDLRCTIPCDSTAQCL